MKAFSYVAAAALTASLVASPAISYAADEAAAETPAAATAESSTAAPAQAAPAVSLPYTYTSKLYGFTIQCPQKPVGVIPASMLYENEKGDILIFENEEYNIKYAWIITEDAFDNKKVPNLNKLNEKDAEALLKNIMGSNGYEGIMLVNLTAKNKGIYAVTAKEVEIDTDGDGKPDATATANTQMAVLFFRGDKGGRYAMKLIDNPTLRSTSLTAFQKGAGTFVEK